jgi:hypothetical protein
MADNTNVFYNELLARLQKGESVDKLANELTKAINDANTEHERLCREAAEEAKRAEAEAKRKSDKVAAMDQLLDGLYGLLAAYDVDKEILSIIDELDASEVIQEIDAMLGFAAPQSEPAKQGASALDDFLNKYVR